MKDHVPKFAFSLDDRILNSDRSRCFSFPALVESSVTIVLKAKRLLSTLLIFQNLLVRQITV
jgi:hypothetical protein